MVCVRSDVLRKSTRGDCTLQRPSAASKPHDANSVVVSGARMRLAPAQTASLDEVSRKAHTL
jgi:hypothetical protein